MILQVYQRTVYISRKRKSSEKRTFLSKHSPWNYALRIQQYLFKRSNTKDDCNSDQINPTLSPVTRTKIQTFAGQKIGKFVHCSRAKATLKPKEPET